MLVKSPKKFPILAVPVQRTRTTKQCQLFRLLVLFYHHHWLLAQLGRALLLLILWFPVIVIKHNSSKPITLNPQEEVETQNLNSTTLRPQNKRVMAVVPLPDDYSTNEMGRTLNVERTDHVHQ